MTDMIIGGGEVGLTLYKVLGEQYPIVDKEVDKRIIKPFDKIEIMHICIGYIDEVFQKYVVHYVSLYEPEIVMIHSTVPVGTTDSIQAVLKIPVIYAPTRGVHSRFEKDMRRYTKYWASADEIDFETTKKITSCFDRAGMKYERWDTPKELELAKTLTDTTYYGWLIAYKLASDMACEQLGVNKEKIWKFAEEPHKFLGNRPIMYANPNGIGGHCVLPNLKLNRKNEVMQYIADVIENLNTAYVSKDGGI